jgi:hypothetical protein
MSNSGAGGLLGLLAGVSPGNAFAAAVWSFGLFFKSPLQILLVFLGRGLGTSRELSS